MPLSQIKPIPLEAACSALTEFCSSRVVGQANTQSIKVAKVQGESPWHSHEREDKMFVVMRGELCIGRADGDRWWCAPANFVVPWVVRHNASARAETLVALIESVTTLHTGRGTDADDTIARRTAWVMRKSNSRFLGFAPE